MSTLFDASWAFVALLGDLSGDSVTAVTVDGQEVALYRLADGVFATANACTHGNARLCDGFVEAGEIECPLHQGRFDIRTGKAMCRPLREDLRIYPVKLDGERIYVCLNTASPSAG
ncbi:non-heme iron oxygenase ferredoxin subunit [Paraburkholderia bryophila]|uniref:non-heme iron oxygenase ferredoxin subunit n=1 Tax=Burkholderiaceae TaxID=119060 RepID=UPI0005520DCB|nr:non-heme iron oxygenase ferredoxin subunit [Burkholderia sp. 9120]